MADLFDVLRASLFTGEDVSLPDWQPVFEEMKQQTVAELPGEWLETHLQAPSWLAYCRMKQGKWALVMYAQDQLLALLEAHSIPCVIIKGAAAAMAYPQPTLRTMGDVDFLVKRADFERAAALLEENGYTLTNPKDAVDYHWGYKKNRIYFELHNRLPVIAKTDEKWIACFERGIDAREWHETEGRRFPVLPSALNGLTLIFHINQHLRFGLGLRQIIDWMMYVHTLSPEQWAGLQPLLESAGQLRLARTVTLLCQRYLGLRRIVEEDAALPVDDLLAYLMEKGNFGKKAGIDGKIAAFSMKAVDMGSFFGKLQRHGLGLWEAARKHAALRPFAWIYMAVKILGMMVKNKKSPKEILKQRRHGVDQRQLIAALGLKMDRTIGRG